MIDKKEVIERLCVLVTKVGSEHFKDELTHDCFCQESGTGNNGFSCDEEILGFIENLVNIALKDIQQPVNN